MSDPYFLLLLVLDDEDGDAVGTRGGPGAA
jgi:hypothetical protein